MDLNDLYNYYCQEDKPDTPVPVAEEDVDGEDTDEEDDSDDEDEGDEPASDV